jgi:hypothetical protein
MKSLIGSCKCNKFDALNSEGDSKLIDAYVFLYYHGYSKEIPEKDINKLKNSFERAVGDFSERYRYDTGFWPANYEDYMTLIKIWHASKPF